MDTVMLAQTVASGVNDISLAHELRTSLLNYADVIIIGYKAYFLRLRLLFNG